jgi:UDP-2,3-diacylglucosamine pyrophosphatase LpxH
MSYAITKKAILKSLNYCCTIDGSKRKFVILSDFHMGIATHYDNFLHNSTLVYFALKQYERDNYTIIVNGDFLELWVNKNIETIKYVHQDIFEILNKANQKGNLIYIAGNHDSMMFFHPERLKTRFSLRLRTNIPCLDVTVYLSAKITRKNKPDILVIHGHQPSFFNFFAIPFLRWGIRYIYRPLEVMGMRDPTRERLSSMDLVSVDEQLTRYAKEKNCIIVAGHTHSSVCEKTGHYYNDGTVIMPRCATLLELEDNTFSLIRWDIHIKNKGILKARRKVLVKRSADVTV